MANDDFKQYFKGFKIEVDPDRMEDTWKELRSKLQGLYDQGRYTKVRLSYKGKPLGPDIPVGLLLAGEVASFAWAGPMTALLVNLGVKAFVDVEVVHEAETWVLQGVELFMDGEVEAAEAKYREALRIKPHDTSALYNLGVLLRVTGRKEEAITCFREAAADEKHPDGSRAREALARMEKPKDL